MIRPFFFASFASLLVACPHLCAADWPQFRGPNGDGHAAATNLPTAWNETTNVAWKTEIPGRGWSSPSLFQNRLYLTTAVPVSPANPDDQQSLHTLCVDAASGRVLWNVEVFKPDTKDVGI